MSPHSPSPPRLVSPKQRVGGRQGPGQLCLAILLASSTAHSADVYVPEVTQEPAYHVRSYRSIWRGFANLFGEPPETTPGGTRCWCRRESAALPGTFSSWVYIGEVARSAAGTTQCQTDCANQTVWRARSRWNYEGHGFSRSPNAMCNSAELTNQWGVSSAADIERQNLAFDIDWGCSVSQTEPPGFSMQSSYGTVDLTTSPPTFTPPIEYQMNYCWCRCWWGQFLLLFVGVQRRVQRCYELRG